MLSSELLDEGLRALQEEGLEAANQAFDLRNRILDLEAQIAHNTEEVFATRVHRFFGVEPPSEPKWTDAVQVLKEFHEDLLLAERQVAAVEDVTGTIHLERDIGDLLKALGFPEDIGGAVEWAKETLGEGRE